MIYQNQGRHTINGSQKMQQQTNNSSNNPYYAQSCKRLYKICIILPVVLYGCENLSLSFREECRLRMFENSVEKNICA